MLTILFTDAAGHTAGMLVADDTGSILRHAHDGGDYAKAFVLTTEGFRQLDCQEGYVDFAIDAALLGQYAPEIAEVSDAEKGIDNL